MCTLRHLNVLSSGTSGAAATGGAAADAATGGVLYSIPMLGPGPTGGVEGACASEEAYEVGIELTGGVRDVRSSVSHHEYEIGTPIAPASAPGYSSYSESAARAGQDSGYAVPLPVPQHSFDGGLNTDAGSLRELAAGEYVTAEVYTGNGSGTLDEHDYVDATVHDVAAAVEIHPVTGREYDLPGAYGVEVVQRTTNEDPEYADPGANLANLAGVYKALDGIEDDGQKAVYASAADDLPTGSLGYDRLPAPGRSSSYDSVDRGLPALAAVDLSIDLSSYC